MKGDTILALVPLVDSFEGAKTSLKPESEGEKRIDAAYQVPLCAMFSVIVPAASD